MLIKPLPNLDIVYSMVVQVEDQRNLSEGSRDRRNFMSMHVGKQHNYPSQTSSQCHFGNYKQGYQKQGSGPSTGPFKKRMSKEEKRKLKCTHCQGMGYEVDECFKLHGVPEWYTKCKESRTQPRANFTESWMSSENCSRHVEQKDQTHVSLYKLSWPNVWRIYCNISLGLLTSKVIPILCIIRMEKSHPFDGHFAFIAMPSMESKEWIIDSGASSHICYNPEILHTTYKLDGPTAIFLPDGSSRTVAFAGKARISKYIYC